MAIARSRISSKVIANPPSTHEAYRRWFGRLQMPSGRMCTANGRQRKAEIAGSAVRRGDLTGSSVSSEGMDLKRRVGHRQSGSSLPPLTLQQGVHLTAVAL